MINLFFRRKPFERRRFNRIRTRNLMAIGNAQPQILNLVNISEGGVQFTSRDRIRKNQMIDIVINLTELNTEIIVSAKVVWSKNFSETEEKLYRIGVRFTALNQEVLSMLHSYTRSLLCI